MNFLIRASALAMLTVLMAYNPNHEQETFIQSDIS